MRKSQRDKQFMELGQAGEHKTDRTDGDSAGLRAGGRQCCGSGSGRIITFMDPDPRLNLAIKICIIGCKFIYIHAGKKP